MVWYLDARTQSRKRGKALVQRRPGAWQSSVGEGGESRCCAAACPMVVLVLVLFWFNQFNNLRGWS